MFGKTAKRMTVKNALTDPESIDWSHQTVKSTKRLFNGLIKAAKNGHWLEAIRAYFAIAKSGNMDVFTGRRLTDIWKADYMHYEDGKPIPESEFNAIVHTYAHYFWDLLGDPAFLARADA